MIHIEGVERRCLFTLVLDSTFGTGGKTVLPKQFTPLSLLATHSSIYVDAYDSNRERHVIFKYTNKGKRDTSWGTNGYVVPGLFSGPDASYPGYRMAYDTRTSGLVVASARDAVVKVQRLTADGQADAAWGDNGRVVYSEKNTLLVLGAIKPLASKRLLFAFDRQQQQGEPFKGTPKPGGADDVAMLRIDRLGRHDKTFNGGRALTVVGGSFSADVEYDRGVAASGTQQFNDPTFRDLALNDDGTYRVVTTTQSGKSILSRPDPGRGVAFSNNTTTSAESRVVTYDGVVVRKGAGNFVLKRERSYLVGDGSRGTYVVRGAIGVENNGVAVFADAGRDTALKQIGPSWYSAVTPVFPTDDEEDAPSIREVVRNEAGQAVAVGQSGEITAYARGIGYRPEVYIGDYNSAATVDDDGRVLTAYIGQITRLR
jgi:hypothetical protein